VFCSIWFVVTAIVHNMYRKKCITLVWQVDNVSIEAASLIQAGGRSNLF